MSLLQLLSKYTLIGGSGFGIATLIKNDVDYTYYFNSFFPNFIEKIGINRLGGLGGGSGGSGGSGASGSSGSSGGGGSGGGGGSEGIDVGDIIGGNFLKMG